MARTVSLKLCSLRGVGRQAQQLSQSYSFLQELSIVLDMAALPNTYQVIVYYTIGAYSFRWSQMKSLLKLLKIISFCFQVRNDVEYTDSSAIWGDFYYHSASRIPFVLLEGKIFLTLRLRKITKLFL